MENATPTTVQPPPDRVKSFAQRAVFMVSIPASRALLCLENDCQMIYDSVSGACPKCGSRASLSVLRYIERRGVA